MLLNRVLYWASLPHTTRKGAMPFLSVKEMGRLDCSVTNKQERPHLVKAYKNLAMPAFNKHVYTNEEDYRALRWVQKRGINLRGFRLELKSGGYTLRQLGEVLHELMSKGSMWYDMEIAEYCATRGKLTNLDVEYPGGTALTYASKEGHLNIVEALLAAGGDQNS